MSCIPLLSTDFTCITQNIKVNIKLCAHVVDSFLIVTPIVGFCNCSMLCCALFLVLQSSGWGRESWLLSFVCLPGVS